MEISKVGPKERRPDGPSLPNTKYNKTKPNIVIFNKIWKEINN